MSKNVAVKPINEVNPSRLMNIILLTDRFLSRFAKAVCTLTRYSEFQRYHPHPQPARTIAGEYERDGESVMLKPTSRYHQQNYMLKHQPIQQAVTVQRPSRNGSTWRGRPRRRQQRCRGAGSPSPAGRPRSCRSPFPLLQLSRARGGGARNRVAEFGIGKARGGPRKIRREYILV